MSGLSKLLGATAVVSAALATAASDASAQSGQPCGPREVLVDKLGQQYGEAVSAEGVDAEGNLVQVFSSEQGTWTIAVTLPGGPSCIVASGEGWNDDQIAEAPGAGSAGQGDAL